MTKQRPYKANDLLPEFMDVKLFNQMHPDYGYRKLGSLMRLKGWQVSDQYVMLALRQIRQKETSK